MAAGGYEWDIPFTDSSLAYVKKWHSEIVDLSQSYAHSADYAVALAIAGAISRETVANEKIYPAIRSGWAGIVADHSRYLGSGNNSQADWVAAYQYIKSNGFKSYKDLPANKLIPDNPFTTYFNAYTAIMSDAGTIGKIRILSALDLLVSYQATSGSSDPLKLSQYFGDYSKFFADLTNLDKDTAAKIALLAVVEARDFALSTNGSVAYSGLSEGQRAAILVKAYATGLDTLKAQTSDKGYKQYNLAGPGSDITLYDKNLKTLYTSLGLAIPNRLEVGFDANSKSLPTDGVPSAPYVQYMTIDWAVGDSAPPSERFDLQWYRASDSYNSGLVPFVTNTDVGQVRLDRVRKLTLTSGADTLALVGELKDPGELKIDAGAGLDKVDLS